MMMTKSPPSRCGAKVGLCLPRSNAAAWVASRPRTTSVASMTYQARSISPALGLYVRTVLRPSFWLRVRLVVPSIPTHRDERIPGLPNRWSVVGVDRARGGEWEDPTGSTEQQQHVTVLLDPARGQTRKGAPRLRKQLYCSRSDPAGFGAERTPAAMILRVQCRTADGLPLPQRRCRTAGELLHCW